MKSGAALALGAALWGGAAWAQEGCPTAADLRQGIRVETDDGVVQVFRKGDEPGVVRMEVRESDGTTLEADYAQGLYLLGYVYRREDGSADEASRVRYDFGRPASEIPAPTAGGRFSATVIYIDESGRYPQAMAQAAGAAETREIGGCTYGVVPLAITYDAADAYMEGLDWFPDLGIAVLRWQEATGQPRYESTPVAIAAAGKALPAGLSK